MKEISQYDRRTVYIPSILPPKPEAKPQRTFTMAEMMADAKACNAKLRRVTEARAPGYSKKKYPPKMKGVTLPQGMTFGQDLTRDDVLAIIAINPGATVNQIGTAIGKSRQGVRYHVEALIKAGLVRWERKRHSDAQQLWVAK